MKPDSSYDILRNRGMLPDSAAKADCDAHDAEYQIRPMNILAHSAGEDNMTLLTKEERESRLAQATAAVTQEAKEIDQMRAERPTTLTAEAPPLNSVKLSINAKQQLTGEVNVYGNDMMAAYIEAFKIISIIKAKNEGIK